MPPPLSNRPRQLLWLSGLCLMLGWAGACGPSMSQVPLFNAAPEGPEEYFYGAARLPAPPGVEREGRSALGPVTPKPRTSVVAKIEEPKGKSAKADASAAADAGATEPSSAAAKNQFAGDYRGTDRVAIRLTGQPLTEEVDPKAHARIEPVEDGDNEFVVSILDSNSGDDLCSLLGRAEGTNLRFEPDQDCFEGTLGLDVTTALVRGNASVVGDTLNIDFEVALRAVESDDEEEDDDPVEGTLKYHFDGKRQ